MEMSQFFTLLAVVVNEIPAAIKPETELSSLAGWDSMGVVLWIAEIDEKFGVILQPRQLADCQTARDLADLLGDRILI